MSNDDKHGDTDLSLDLEDVITNDSSVDDAERSDDQSDEVGTELDLEPEEVSSEDKAQKREQAAEAHAKSWAGKIVSGKATYDDIPKNHQYLVPMIEKLLGKKEEVKQAKPSSAEIMSIVRFEALKEKLKSTDLEPNQVKDLNAEFKELMATGKFDADVALKKAIKYAGVVIGERAEMPKIKSGSTPATSKPKFTGTEDPNTMSRSELAEFLANRPR